MDIFSSMNVTWGLSLIFGISKQRAFEDIKNSVAEITDIEGKTIVARG